MRHGWMVVMVVLAMGACLSTAGAAEAPIILRRVPGGIQPRAVIDSEGVVHLVYYTGEARRGDLFYVRSHDAGATFTAPIRVNTKPGSAVAMGNIRGPQIALDANRRVHVVWNGSTKGGGHHEPAPLWYARLNDAGNGFEPQRDMMGNTHVLDGGSSVAVSGERVYVVWHAAPKHGDGEEKRRLFVALSNDGGRTFQNEVAVGPPGACPCCGLRAFATNPDRLHVMYRASDARVNRPAQWVTLNVTKAGAISADVRKLDLWEVNTCPMSLFDIARLRDGQLLRAWENDGQIKLLAGGRAAEPFVPAVEDNARFPVIAAADDGRVLLAWTEGITWGTGGRLAWQIYNEDGTLGERGRVDGVPAWSIVSAVALADGRFLLLY